MTDLTEKKRCAKVVYRPHGGFGGSSCGSSATKFENGRWWCVQHAPSFVASKRKSKSEIWKAECEWKESLQIATQNLKDAKDRAVVFVHGLAIDSDDVDAAVVSAKQISSDIVTFATKVGRLIEEGRTTGYAK